MKRCSKTLVLVALGVWLAAPGLANDFYAKGMAKATAEEWPVALDLLEKAILAEPNNLFYGADYRQAVIASGEYDRSLAFFEQLVADNPEAPNAFLNFGYAHVDKIPVEGAITAVILANTALTHFTTALEMEETWLVRYTRGNSYLYWPAIFGRAQDGVDDLLRAIEMAEGVEKKPFHGRAWAALGDGYWRLEDPEKAAETWRKGLELYPENEEIKDRLANVGEGLDAHLEAMFETSRRVGTHLREMRE
ncbi:MAG: tetratricopeptide repeat protein [Acidobacteriota bacterium]